MFSFKLTIYIFYISPFCVKEIGHTVYYNIKDMIKEIGEE